MFLVFAMTACKAAHVHYQLSCSKVQVHRTKTTSSTRSTAGEQYGPHTPLAAVEESNTIEVLAQHRGHVITSNHINKSAKCPAQSIGWP
jgi:hypothetical protein